MHARLSKPTWELLIQKHMENQVEENPVDCVRPWNEWSYRSRSSRISESETALLESYTERDRHFVFCIFHSLGLATTFQGIWPPPRHRYPLKRSHLRFQSQWHIERREHERVIFENSLSLSPYIYIHIICMYVGFGPLELLVANLQRQGHIHFFWGFKKENGLINRLGT